MYSGFRGSVFVRGLRRSLMATRVLLPLLISLGFASAAFAAQNRQPDIPPIGGALSAQSVRQCNGAEPVPAIMGCTAIINARSSSPTQKSGALTNRGRAFAQRGEMERAIADFNQAVQIDPMNSRAWANRGDFYSAMGDYERAVQDYDGAIKANPEDFEAYNQRGTMHLIMGEPDRAIPFYDKAIAVNPK